MKRIFVVIILISGLMATRSFAQMGHGMMRHMGGEMQIGAQQRLKCAEEWLKKAIELHELHMKDPKTTTDESQMELMQQIKNAYDCVIGKDSETGMMPHTMP